MTFALWCLVVGALLLTMALSGSLLERLPLSTSMLYLAVGFGLGPAGWGLIDADPFRHTELLERLAEIAVLVSLFVTGLKLNVPLRDARWWLPLRLATMSMLITIALIAAAAMVGLGMSLGAAVLLGAILAPTDPVLASDVQVENAGDRDRLRFSLSGEGGLNDGAAFPFVMLGLGLLGLHDLGSGGWRWLAIDVVWAIVGGLALGALLGYSVGKLVLYLRVHHRAAVGLDEFLALGLIGSAYGAALLLHAYGFLAVFAAGLALRRVETRPSDEAGLHKALHEAAHSTETDAEAKVSTDPTHAANFMTQSVLGFNEQLERLGEIVVVLAVGAMLSYVKWPAAALWLIPLLLLVIRPVGVLLGLLGSRTTRSQRGLMAWFGIRGIGSIYYVMYAINHGVERPLAERLVAVTLMVVTASVVLHGVSVTPLMRWYAKRSGGKAVADTASAG